VIVVFGSINVDLVVRVAALPRPGETVLAPSYDAVAGGKGANQAVAAARAGAAVRMVGCVGRDGFADLALATLRDAGVGLSAVAAVDAPTGCAMICVDAQGRNQIAVASGANRRVRAARLDDAALGPETTLVLQLEIDHGETWAVIERARSRGARIVLNAAPAAKVPAAALRALDVLIMNEIEAGMLAGGASAGDPLAVARNVAAAMGVVTIVTLGENGACAFEPGEAWRIGALPVTALDTTPAGDAFVGVLAAALDAGTDLAGVLHRASVAGGLACTKPGAQPSLPDAAAIDAALGDLAPAERI
jgi:ribokinase